MLLVKHVLISVDTSYNILIGRMMANALGMIASTHHLAMKFPNQRGDIVTIKVGKLEARKCYTKSLLVKPYILAFTMHADAIDVNHMDGTALSWADLDSRRNEEDKRPMIIEDLCSFQLGKKPHQCTKIGERLDDHLLKRIEDVLTQNVDLFAWNTADMPDIDPNFICHKLFIFLKAKPVAQQRWKLSDEC